MDIFTNKSYKVMKNLLIIVSLLFFTINLSSQDNITFYKANLDRSYVKWEGKKLTGSHWGKLKLDSSYIETRNGKISGGVFIVNMNSIDNEDVKNESERNKLIKHLKADDFFGVETYPTAKMVIVKALPSPKAKKGSPNYTIIADLTIKDSTHKITFPAEVIFNSGKIISNAKFTFDRTKYGIRFNSKKFIPNIGDYMIYDDVTLNINLICEKAITPKPIKKK